MFDKFPIAKIIDSLFSCLFCCCIECDMDQSEDSEQNLLLLDQQSSIDRNINQNQNTDVINNIRPSRRGVLVINITYDTTIYAAVYYKKLKSKERVFFRYSEPETIPPSRKKRLPKPSCICQHSYGARVFFTSNISVLQNKISKDYFERIGSHSVSLSHKIIVSIEDELLQGYTELGWKNVTRKIPNKSNEIIYVRTPYDKDLNKYKHKNNWNFNINDEKDDENQFSNDEFTNSFEFEFKTDSDSDHDINQEIINEDNENINNQSSKDEQLLLSSVEFLNSPNKQRRFFKTSSLTSNSLEEIKSSTVDQTSNIKRTSSVPLPPENSKFYCPPKKSSLSRKEKEIQQKRSKKCKKSLLKYIPELESLLKGENELFPGVALCLSGGSYRSLVASLGAIQGMKETGLLDCITYISALSGTIWSVGMWYSFPDQDLDQLIRDLPNMIGTAAHSHLKSKEVWEMYKNLQNQKKQANLPKCRFSDLYAISLTKQLLSGIGNDFYSYKISDLGKIDKLLNGDLPIPIFTSVFQEPHNYEWLEITPFEIGSDYLSSFIPTEAFGSTFVAGELSFKHPEITLGQLFGLSSAVFCLTVHRLWKEIIIAYDLHPIPVETDTIQSEEKDDQPNLHQSNSHSINADDDDVKNNNNQDSFILSSSTNSTSRRNTITTPRRTKSHEIPIVNLQNTTAGDYAISLIQLFDHSTPNDEPMLVRKDESSSSSDEDVSIFEEDKKHPQRRKKVRIARKLEKKFSKMKATKKFLVRPATIPNFAFGLANPMKRVKFLQLIDAGMDFCIPFPPLIREERNVKVIIIVDMSAPPDCVEGNSLQAAIKWAKNHGYYVPDASYDCVSGDENIFVFLSDHILAPSLIYIPLRHNPEYGDFDPVENYAEGGYCSTNSLRMEPEQIEELCGLLRCTFKTVDDTIKNTIKQTFSQLHNCSL